VQGKTIQTIVTILDNRPKLQHAQPGAKHPPNASDLEQRKGEEVLWNKSVTEWKHEMEMNNVSKKLYPKKYSSARAGTLVICPMIALTQWKTEIEKFTQPDALKVAIYHGPNRCRELPPEKMRLYDVVLTTYQVVEQDFRKMVSPNKVCCPNCGGKFKIDKLRVHLKYFCGEGARRTDAQRRQRRTADRPNSHNDDRDAPSAKGKSKRSEKPPMTDTTPRKKNIIRLTSTADYDSDSEISVDSDVQEVILSKRPSRSAAASASKKLAAAAKEDRKTRLPASRKRKMIEDDSESEFGSDDVDESEETSSDESSVDVKISTLTKTSGKEALNPKAAALERAREKQRQAIQFANEQKNAGKKVMKVAGKNAPAKKSTGKGKGKKFDDEPPSSSSDDEVDDADPMADIDLNKLLSEAMAGSRFSPLHAFCWWRIVLDEAHFSKFLRLPIVYIVIK
jgi:hypothetical protein